jgi:16S rRNA (guanine527-N7)-methyltransferase
VNREREPLPTHVWDTPELPTAYTDALDRGLEALGLRLVPGARAAIDGHVRLLLAWTPAINLTAIREPGAVAVGHVIDSLTAVDAIRARGVDRLLDLGSGGGFPGIPLAAALPDLRVTLLESIAKKARFLAVATQAVGLAPRVSVLTARAEDLADEPAHGGGWPLVTVRAVASLADLVELAFPLLADGGALIAWKRGDAGDESAAARRAIDALGGGTLTTHEPAIDGLDGNRLVIATRTGTVPSGYPRDPAARRRRPW